MCEVDRGGKSVANYDRSWIIEAVGTRDGEKVYWRRVQISRRLSRREIKRGCCGGKERMLRQQACFLRDNDTATSEESYKSR